MIPGEIIDLIQIVIVIGRRIMGCREILLADVERFVLTLCQEIIASIRIGVSGTGGSSGSLPVYRSDTIEQPATVNHTGGHFFKVVRLCEIVTCQLLWLQCSTIAIEFHLRGIGETGLLDKGIRQLIEARLRDADLRPCARLEDRMVGIAFLGC